MRKKSKKSAIIFLSLGLLLIMLLAALILLLIDRFFISFDPSTCMFQLKYILIDLGLFLFIFNIERTYQDLVKTKFFFSIFTILIIPLLIFSTPNSVLLQLSIIGIAFNVLFILIFFIKLGRQSIGKIKQRIRVGLIGLLITTIGMGVSSENVVHYITNELIIIVGYLFFFLGILLVYISFYDVSLFLEADWKENLISLNIIDLNSNTCMYYQDFQELEKKTDSLEDSSIKRDLLSGGIVGIQSIISAITNSSAPNLRTIVQGDTQILVEYGEGYICTFFVKKPLDSLFYFLKTISIQFKRYFGDTVKNWDGNSETFLPLKGIISKILTV